MRIAEFQTLIEELYAARDGARGPDRNFVWFVEEVGELARELTRPRDPTGKNLREEFADVFAWLASIASIAGVSLEEAVIEKYGKGCPRCGAKPCRC